MRVIRVADNGQPSVLVEDNAARPRPGRGELLIRVRAAGVTKDELSWYPTTHQASGAPRLHAVPAHEFSGVVEETGEDVGSLELGREVFGMNDWYADGAMAEYCTAPFFAVVPKPPGLTHVEAASVPIDALTAWQGLFDRAKVQAGERVLIQGGAGAVGIFVVQLAHLYGARVIATASAAGASLVSSLGADEVIDYKSARFEDVMRDLDVVFDTVGGETLDRSWQVLRPGGRLVTVAASAEQATDPRVKEAFFIVEPNQKQLYEIADLLQAGELRAVVGSVVPLSESPQLFGGETARCKRGKCVVEIRN
ncbi:MAG TPA: NADP-dependent oxidoreductase [Bryobacteraceae bacterium]|nr:NADP-dependent oxidoreductase [Bryobacteraceae bacterium]